MKFQFSSIKSIRLFKKGAHRPIVEWGDFMWKLSIAFLVSLALAVLAFDGYLFVLARNFGESIDVPQENPSLRQPLQSATEILKKRADLLKSAGKDLPTADPFE